MATARTTPWLGGSRGCIPPPGACHSLEQGRCQPIAHVGGTECLETPRSSPLTLFHPRHLRAFPSACTPSVPCASTSGSQPAARPISPASTIATASQSALSRAGCSQHSWVPSERDTIPRVASPRTSSQAHVGVKDQSKGQGHDMLCTVPSEVPTWGPSNYCHFVPRVWTP